MNHTKKQTTTKRNDMATQNGTTLTTTYNGSELTNAILSNSERRVEIEKGKSTATWTIYLTKISKDYDGAIVEKAVRTYTGKTQSEALKYFDKKQHELGFFNA